MPLTGTLAAQKAGSSKESAAAGQQPPPPVQALLNLLADQTVQKWLEKQGSAESAAPPAHGKSEASVPDYFSSQVNAIRAHIAAVVAALPDLPNQFTHAADLLGADLEGRGSFPISRLVLVFAALGFGAEALFRKATQRVRRRLDGLPVASVKDRLRLIAERLVFAASVVGVFAIGSVGAFLAFDWPPLLREIILGFLIAVVIIRIAGIAGDFLLAPGDERFRIVPMARAAARFWCRRLRAFIGWFAVGFVTVGLLRPLDFSLPERQLVAYALGLGLLVIALEAVWRRPVGRGPGAEAPAGETRRFGHGGQNVLLSIGIVLLWVFWVARAMPSFWLLLIIIALPLASAVTRRAVDHLLRPPGAVQVDDAAPSVTAVCIERGMRALLIIGAVFVLAWGWGVPLDTLTGQDTLLSRTVHGVLSAIIILLVADLLWQATRAAIDRKLAGAADPGLPNTDEARRRARLRTLCCRFSAMCCSSSSSSLR